MSCGVGCRCDSDPELMWFWRRPVAMAPIRPLAWEPLYASGVAQEMAKSWKNPKNKKLSNCLPKWLGYFAFLPAVNDSSSCSTSLSGFDVVSALDFGQFNRSVLIPHFNLHFPDDMSCGASFYILIWHLYVDSSLCHFFHLFTILLSNWKSKYCSFFKAKLRF